jgi:hypothetical protein
MALSVQMNGINPPTVIEHERQAQGRRLSIASTLDRFEHQLANEIRSDF